MDGGEVAGAQPEAQAAEAQQPKGLQFRLGGKSKNAQKRRAAGEQPSKEGEDEQRGKRELIVALEGKDVVGADGTVSTSGAPRVIQSLQNTWKPGGKAGLKAEREALEGVLHEVENADRFEDPAEEQQEDGSVQYGLSVREKLPGEKGPRQGARRSLRDIEAQKLQEDLGELPDNPSLEAYESMPIESFGEALLRGLGWQKGQGIGRNGKGDAEAVEYVPRPTRLGLGATPRQKPEQEKKYIKPGETRGQRKDLVAPVGPDGKVRHVKRIGEKLVERDDGSVREGKMVRIVGGRHEGLEGRVVRGPREEAQGGSRKFVVRLLQSEEEVTVGEEEVMDRRAWEEETGREEARRRALQQLAREGEETSEKARGRAGEEVKRGRGDVARGEVGHRKEKRMKVDDGSRLTEKGASHRDTNGDASSHKERGPSDRHETRREQVEEAERRQAKARAWLMPHIRVRVVSKQRAGGRLYLSKGVVLDVLAPQRCDVLLDGDGRRLVENVHAGELETALPKRDGRVAIVWGPHRGERGKLLERIAKTEEAVVQLAQSFEIVRLPLDDVAEFVGENVAYEA